MKLNWDDVKDIFESAALWENGHDMYWYRLMWGLVEYRGLNVYSNDEEVKTVFSRVFAIISIYHEFINICFDDDEDIAEAFSSSEYAYSIMRYLFNEKDVKDIFKALNEELGLVRTFYSIFITCVEFRDGKISYVEDEDFDEDELYESALMFREYCSENEYYDEDEEFPDDPSEDYYNSFETYLEVLATSSMSILNECTPDKLAGYIYLSRNMNRSGAV